MKDNLINQQFSSKKRRITSWVLGIISIVISVLAFTLVILVIIIDNVFSRLLPVERFMVEEFITEKFGYNFLLKLLLNLTAFSHIVAFMIATFGLIKGIKEVKSLRKKSAFKGIILCLIGLAVAIILLFLDIGMMVLTVD